MVQKGSDNMPEVDVIRAQLFALQDKEYQVFYSRLMPTLPPETVIGVRVPLLRRLAKQLADTPEAEAFLQCLPHFYYEENALHAFLLEPVRDYGTALAATERFLPYVDNWAVCDSFSPRCLRSISRNCCVLSGAGWALTKCIPCATGSGC
jgi:hypothetical protein